jgi:hypothetical protein
MIAGPNLKRLFRVCCLKTKKTKLLPLLLALLLSCSTIGRRNAGPDGLNGWLIADVLRMELIKNLIGSCGR